MAQRTTRTTAGRRVGCGGKLAVRGGGSYRAGEGVLDESREREVLGLGGASHSLHVVLHA